MNKKGTKKVFKQGIHQINLVHICLSYNPDSPHAMITTLITRLHYFPVISQFRPVTMASTDHIQSPLVSSVSQRL